MTNNFVFEKDLSAKKIHVVREFNAPVEKVWKAWTDSLPLLKMAAVSRLMLHSLMRMALFRRVHLSGTGTTNL